MWRAVFLAVAMAAAFAWGRPQDTQTADANTQDAASKEAQRRAPFDEPKGMPPRSAPTDYPAVAQAGPITIAAEFQGHAVPTPDAPYNTDDYVVVETGIYGPAGAHARLSSADFSLRINGKKAALPSVPYELVRSSLTDPSWAPPKDDSKSKGGLSTGQQDTSQPPPKMPMEMRLAMEQHVRSAVMLQGDRALPQAGLLFFEYHGKTKNIHSLQLIYNGPSGKATLPLQP